MREKEVEDSKHRNSVIVKNNHGVYTRRTYRMSIIEKKNLTVVRKRGNIPKIPFSKMQEKILGENYRLTIVFCTPKESKERNRVYRNKNYATNILSFPLSKREGEMYISLSVAKKDAKNFSMSYKKFLNLLVIHGMLHLKGMAHGSTMEKLEAKYLNTFFRGT